MLKVSFLKTKFFTIDNAEDNRGLTIRHYMNTEMPCTRSNNSKRFSKQFRENDDSLVLTKDDQISKDEMVKCIQEVYNRRCELSLTIKLLPKVKEELV